MTRLDGTNESFVVQSISDGMVFGDDQQKWPLDDFRELKTNHALLGGDPSTTRITLQGGGVVFAREVSLESGTVKLETDVSELNLDIFDIGCIYFKKENLEEIDKLLSEPSTETDRLLVATSQGPRTVSGLVESITKDAIRIDYKDEVRTIGLDKVIALVPAKLESGRKVSGLLTTIDRSELLFESLAFDGQSWELKWGNRSTTLTGDNVASLEIRSDREVFVSDLMPTRNEVQTMLAPRRSTLFDTNVFGETLALKIPDGLQTKRVEFVKGIGTQSRSRLSFAIPEGCRQLTGWVGVDATAEPHGDCVCSILVDGIQVFSNRVTGGDAAIKIDIELNSASELELLVEPGNKLDLSDWVDWADLRLVK